MMQIRFGATAYDDMGRALMVSELESCAILLAAPPISSARASFIVRETYIAPQDAYDVRTSTRAQLKPGFIVPMVQRAREQRLSVVFVHTHPFADGLPSFSPIDDIGETALQEFLARRVSDLPHAALVLGADGCTARLLGVSEPLDVIQVGATVVRMSGASGDSIVDTFWDRQVRAFGVDGQRAVRSARVAIIGLGGTGSVVAQQLAHLGVSDFVLIDPDVVDETNLNRLVGATFQNVGHEKVSVAKRSIERVNSSASVQAIRGDVTDLRVADALLNTDAMFGCTDSHASRAILNQLAYQYFVPLFDVGVGIVAHAGQVTHIAGRAQMASPGLACLVCGGVIDSDAVRRELQSEAHRAADPYISGFTEPQPAVISLNSTMASFAVTMFMSAFTSVPGEARLQYYNGLTGSVRAATVRADPTCVVCSAAGALGMGHGWNLPGRN
jgi:molybdopterin-synthase adenylyltransferase